MHSSLQDVLAGYNDHAALEHASTIPASWYVDERVASLERESVFGRTWQVAARAEQVAAPGAFVTAELAGEPLLIVRGRDRDEAISRMARALEMFIVQGIYTSIPLHQKIMRHPDFIAGNLDTKFIERLNEVRSKA